MPAVKIRRVNGRQRRALTAAAAKSLTAAAQRVTADNATTSFRKSIGSSGADWHDKAWFYVEHVPELQYFVNWRAWSASRCRFIASSVDDSGAPTGTLDDDDPNADRVREIINDIAGGVGGQSRLIRRSAYLTSVTGEYWVTMVVRDPAREESPDHTSPPVDPNRPGFQREQWFILGRNQINVTGMGKIELKLPDGAKHMFDPNVDLLFRAWDEHPFDPTQPVSPIWSTRDALHEIVQTTATIDAANNSRLIGNGVWFVPQEMSLPQNLPAPKAAPRGQPTPDDIPADFFNEPNSVQALQDLLFEVGSTAKRNPDSQAAMMPIFAGVPAEYIKAAKDGLVKPFTEIPETALKTRDASVRRLATGLDTSPERLLGLSQGNHWSAWAIDESDIKIHVAPVVELLCAAMTQEVLRYKLAQEGIDPDAYVIWYDTTALTQDPDKTDEARDAFDRGAITAAALREYLGFDEVDGYDLESAEGWIQLALDKLAEDPAVNAAVFGPILQAAAARVGLEVQPAPAALPPGEDEDEDDEPPADAEPDEPQGTEDEPDGSQPNQAAAMMVTRLCVNRALELSSKRRRTRADAPALRDIPIESAHKVLGPAGMDQVQTLIRGWDAGLMDNDLEAVGLDCTRFRTVVYSITAIALVTASSPIVTAEMLPRRR